MNPADFDGPLGMPQRIQSCDLSPKLCAVLVPFQGRIVSQCQSALLELERRGYVVRRVEGYSAIDQARNQIGSDALADGFHETLWIDSDVGFDPNDIEKVRKHGLPITCGVDSAISISSSVESMCRQKDRRQKYAHVGTILKLASRDRFSPVIVNARHQWKTSYVRRRILWKHSRLDSD